MLLLLISISLISLLFLLFLLFLLLDTFNFHDVVDKYPARFRWGPWHPGREQSLPQVMSPTTTSSQRLMLNTPQESSSEQRFPDDFDYDDVTIGKTLLDGCRRQADHSEEEGLSSCLVVVSQS